MFVDIPPQTVNDGLVRLRVTEGRIESTVIKGAQYFPERDVISRLPSTTPGTVLQVSKLQSELAAVNAQTADRSVVPILKAGSEPGTVDLALQVNDKLPLHGSLEFNNQATIDTKPLRLVASLSYGDLFGRMDTLSFQYQGTPQQFDQVRVIAVDYALHTFESGLQPSFMYINSNSNVATVAGIGVLGIGEIAGFRLAYSLPSAGSLIQSLTLGADYKHFRNTINLDATTALNTPISYVNLSLTYAGMWRSDHLTTTANISANAGPRGLVNDSTAFENDRFKGRANYFDIRGDFATLIKLPADMMLRLRVAGQGAAEPLITNEDYSIGGAGRCARLSRSGGTRRQGAQGDHTAEFSGPALAGANARRCLRLLRRRKDLGHRSLAEPAQRLEFAQLGRRHRSAARPDADGITHLGQAAHLRQRYARRRVSLSVRLARQFLSGCHRLVILNRYR